MTLIQLLYLYGAVIHPPPELPGADAQAGVCNLVGGWLYYLSFCSKINAPILVTGSCLSFLSNLFTPLVGRLCSFSEGQLVFQLSISPAVLCKVVWETEQRCNAFAHQRLWGAFVPWFSSGSRSLTGRPALSSLSFFTILLIPWDKYGGL